MCLRLNLAKHMYTVMCSFCDRLWFFVNEYVQSYIRVRSKEAALMDFELKDEMGGYCWKAYDAFQIALAI